MPVFTANLHARPQYLSDQPIVLQLDLFNQGNEGCYVNRRGTPFEGIITDCLKITRNGQPRLRYDGPLIKRGPSSPADYFLVPGRKTVSCSLTISEAYETSNSGRYHVSVDTTLSFIRVSRPGADLSSLRDELGRPLSVRLEGNTVEFSVLPAPARFQTSGELARLRDKELNAHILADVLGDQPLEPQFDGGTPEQQGQLRQAHFETFALCTEALARLRNDGEYTTWFGQFTSARFTEVQRVYNAIRDGLRARAFLYSPSGLKCVAGWFAYTHSASSTISFCDLFWQLPARGRDSKAGTLVHEHSHASAGTLDLRATASECQQLALENPDSAVLNANNFEYYANG
jgi:hypothetical protein